MVLRFFNTTKFLKLSATAVVEANRFGANSAQTFKSQKLKLLYFVVDVYMKMVWVVELRVFVVIVEILITNFIMILNEVQLFLMRHCSRQCSHVGVSVLFYVVY